MGKSRYFTKDMGRYTYWSGGSGHNYPSQPPSGVNLSLGTVTGKENLITSQGNPYHLLGKTNRKIGGDFLVVKHVLKDHSPIASMDHSNVPNQPLAPGSGFHYTGPISGLGNLGVNDWPSAVINSSSNLDARGTTAIANTLPTNPLNNFLLSGAELFREGIPSLLGASTWKNRTHIARSAGDEYLNYQFGWQPLLRDIRNFHGTVTNADALIAQYDKGSGKRIKRSFSYPVESDTESVSVTTNSPNPFGGMLLNATYSAECITTKSIERRTWFDGAFTYYIPPFNPTGDNGKRNRALGAYLYGLRPTPEALWNLAPWSWAADWFGNFGDVLHNASAFANDGLKMLYGYVMDQTIHKTHVYWPHIEYKTYPGKIMSLSYTLQTVVKQRRTATPYGFGLDVNSFTDWQWSILGALGLSRGSRFLD